MGPFKCPDCGIWWAGLEHRCLPSTTAAGTTAASSFYLELRCTCQLVSGGMLVPSTAVCPIHQRNPNPGLGTVTLRLS